MLRQVSFVVLFFGIGGIYLFGKGGSLYYRCGTVFTPHESRFFWNQSLYSPHPTNLLNVAPCYLDMKLLDEWKYNNTGAVSHRCSAGPAHGPMTAKTDVSCLLCLHELARAVPEHIT